ncbi:MAG: hypothetical protein WB564_01705 [Dehalococcoidia bacterium]
MKEATKLRWWIQVIAEIRRARFPGVGISKLKASFSAYSTSL